MAKALVTQVMKSIVFMQINPPANDIKGLVPNPGLEGITRRSDVRQDAGDGSSYWTPPALDHARRGAKSATRGVNGWVNGVFRDSPSRHRELVKLESFANFARANEINELAFAEVACESGARFVALGRRGHYL